MTATSVDASERHAGTPSLREIAELGATVFAARKGWYWMKRANPWVLGKDDPIVGPFENAKRAGANCKRALATKTVAAA